MKVFELYARQHLTTPLERVFPYFAEASNLQEITPPWLGFSILTPSPIAMAVGTKIDYRLKLHGLPVRWQSEISRWDPPHSFVDEQRRGPYRLWHHEHRFRPDDKTTWVEDIVRYAVPGDALVNRFFIQPQLREIFSYRQRILAERFGAGAPATLHFDADAEARRLEMNGIVARS